MLEVASIVLFSDDPARTVAFYRALGVALEDEDHGDGRVHAAAEVGHVHVAVFHAGAEGGHPGWRAAGSTFVGFSVASLDGALAAVRALGAAELAGHEVRPWGCRVVVEDPDGRAVEVNERGHCDVAAG